MDQPSFVRFIRRSALLILPLMLAGVVDGQSNPAQGSASSPTTFVRNVDEIAVDFVVRNKKKPVLDLKPEDVVVTDDGSPQGTPAPR